jgi:GH15 family glucan-1,4-alpha-glucosidase
MTSFAPLQPIDRYLPLKDYGLIGAGATAALVGRDGAVAWMCVPRFDPPPLFCRILDATRGGAFVVSPEDLVESRQRYEPEGAGLVTDMRGPSGLLRMNDALTLRSGADLTEDVPAGRGELPRSAAVLGGRVRLRGEITPRGGAAAERRRGGCGGVAPRVPTSSCSSPAPERWTVVLHR